jgi:dTMP kinase
LFITFEGIEGCGKSTQARLLMEYLHSVGHKVLLSREPGGPRISEQIRNILLDIENTEMAPETELLLYLAARNQHTHQLILPALKRGEIVICDRYFDSTYAYQGIGRNLDMKMVRQMNEFATYKLKPDITFILDITVELSRARLFAKKFDRIENESNEFHESVRQAFIDSISENDRYVYMNGDEDPMVIHEMIQQLTISKLGEVL